MLRLTLKQLAARKARLFTTIAAVLLGVTFLAGTLILTDSIDQTLDTLLADANAGTDAYVRHTSELDLGFGESRERIDAHLVDRLGDIEGVDQIAGRIMGYAQLLDRSGEPVGNAQQAPAFGINWVTIPALNPYTITDGHAPLRDDEVVIDRRSARLADLAPGDRATVLTSGEPRDFTIAGVASFAGADSPGNATAVLFTDNVAAELLGEPGYYTGIAVTATGGVTQPELATTIATALGNDAGSEYEVLTGAALTKEDQAAVADNLSFFNVFMLVFAGVAVFVGAFIINNTFSITVAQRTREMAMLRAIGADRRQVLRSVITEAAVVGSVASIAGIALGRAAAAGLVALLDSFGFDMPEGPVVLSTSTVVISLAVGLVVTLTSAWLPARRAARIAPIAAMRSVAYEQRTGARRRAIAGLVVSGLGVAALAAGLAQATAALVGLGAAVVFIGVSVLGPVLVRPITRTVGAPLPRLRGIPGDLARQNAMRNPARTARTAAALMIGVGLVGFITIFAASLRSSIAGSFAEDYRGTHVIDSGAFDATSGISPQLAADIRIQPGVTASSETRITRSNINDQVVFLSAYDAAEIGRLFDLGTVTGNLDNLGGDGIAVLADEAAKNGWKLGDTIPVTFATGTVELTVRATYDHAETWIGNEFVDIAAFDAHVPEQLDTRIYLATDEIGVIEAAADRYRSAEVLDEQGFVDSKNAEVNAMLGVIYAMLALAVVIALLGIANTLTLSILERTRELGLLRALGMSRAQLRATVRWEAVLIALFGTALGLGIGTFFGWALVRTLADAGIDQLTIPVPSLTIVTVIAVVAGVTAALVPARRAARLNILTAIAN